MERETMEFDVVIVGAGPAGLSAAIHLSQLAQKKGEELSVCLLEKGAAIGAHILSGAVLDPSSLNELIPNWQTLNASLAVAVTQDKFWLLTENKAHALPTPALMQNKGNYIISLGELCQWLGDYAQQLGVNIFPGFAATEALFNPERTKVIGVRTGDMGLDKAGNSTPQTQPGVNLMAKHTVFAEGCRGSLSQQIIRHFKLSTNKNPQSYAIGLKELWKIPADKHHLGEVIHTLGWPLDRATYGGGFIYHFKDQLISLGIVIGLDYKNPYLDPFQELQRLKLHPSIKPLLTEGQCLSYGARALNEGGWQALPKLTFPGGLLVGCSAGMVNVGKIKGIHNAIRSGMLAARALSAELKQDEAKSYQQSFNHSPIRKELYQVRNLRPGFHRGLIPGLCYAVLDQYILRGRAPWTFHYQPDHTHTQPANKFNPINYPKPDKKITFDKLTQVYLTAVKHREDQPCHLILKDPNTPVEINYKIYAGLEARYCPAAVYEFIEKDGQKHLQINSANCIHCKTCDIKDPTQNIVWQTPEGGDGPYYSHM